jgi:hypothetical protein
MAGSASSACPVTTQAQSGRQRAPLHRHCWWLHAGGGGGSDGDALGHAAVGDAGAGEGREEGVGQAAHLEVGVLVALLDGGLDALDVVYELAVQCQGLGVLRGGGEAERIVNSL